MSVSAKLGGKVPVVVDVFSSHEQKIYPAFSPDENQIEFEFQTDRISVVLRRFEIYVFGLETEICRGSWFKKIEYQRSSKEHKEETTTDEVMEEEQEAPVPFITHVINNLHSIFSIVEVYINSQ